MRIGIMIGPETRSYARKVDQMADDAQGRRRGGVRHRVDPATPAGLRRHDRGRAHGAGDQPHRARRPRWCRCSRATRSRSGNRRCRCRRRAAVGSASASGRRTTGSSTPCSGCPTSSRRKVVEDYLDVFDAMFAGPGPVDVENDRFRIHNPLDVTDLAPTPVLLAALGPVMLRIAGERADGTVLWMADERAIAEHVVPRITKAAENAGPTRAARRRRRRRSCLCAADEVDAARSSAPTRILGHAEYSPNYQRLLEQGDAADVGDMSAVGTEADIERGCGRTPTPAPPTSRYGSCRWGSGRDEIVASSRRTREFLASLGARAHVTDGRARPGATSSGASIPAMARRRGGRASVTPRRWSTAVDGVTFTELVADVRRVTAALMAVGLEPGERVAVWSPNRYEWLVAALGIARRRWRGRAGEHPLQGRTRCATSSTAAARGSRSRWGSSSASTTRRRWPDLRPSLPNLDLVVGFDDVANADHSLGAFQRVGRRGRRRRRRRAASPRCGATTSATCCSRRAPPARRRAC